MHCVCNLKSPSRALCREFGGCADLVKLGGGGTRTTWGHRQPCNGTQSFVRRPGDQEYGECLTSLGQGRRQPLPGDTGSRFGKRLDLISVTWDLVFLRCGFLSRGKVLQDEEQSGKRRNATDPLEARTDDRDLKHHYQRRHGRDRQGLLAQPRRGHVGSGKE